MKKNGFTLVELLAVIAILAVLVIIALPNIMELFNQAKMNSFTTEIKQIHKTAQSQWMSDSMFKTKEVEYGRTSSGGCTHTLKLSGRNELNYYIKINKAGKVVKLDVEDGTYQYSYSGNGLNIEDIDNVVQVAKIDPDEVINITCSGSSGSGATNIATCVTSGCTKTEKETELIIGGENFYVVSSNSTETVLLAKYDLKQEGNTYTQDTSGAAPNTLKVDFANIGYWDGCKFHFTECTSSPSGLLSPYNANGAAYCGVSSGTNCPYVYDNNATEEIVAAIDGYTQRISTSSGATMTGKLMSVEQAYSLSIDVRKDKNNSVYWLGTAHSHAMMWLGNRGGGISKGTIGGRYSVRPVLIVSTSAL